MKAWTMRSVSACERYFLILPIEWNERKKTSGVVDMGKKGEVWIKRKTKVFDNSSRLNVLITDFNRSSQLSR